MNLGEFGKSVNNFSYCSERDTSFSIVVGGGPACASLQI